MAKAESLCKALRRLRGTENELLLSCSVGISIFPEHGTSFSELYHTSDLALYQAKREGKDRFFLYGIEVQHLGKQWQVDPQWLFSQMEEQIYLCNVDTYELLFANEALLKSLGLKALPAEGLCYEVLHARSTPCKECKNLYLKKGQMSSRIYMDKRVGTIFLIREKALLRKGERIKLAVSTPLPQGWKRYLEKHISPSLFEKIHQV